MSDFVYQIPQCVSSAMSLFSFRVIAFFLHIEKQTVSMTFLPTQNWVCVCFYCPTYSGKILSGNSGGTRCRSHRKHWVYPLWKCPLIGWWNGGQTREGGSVEKHNTTEHCRLSLSVVVVQVLFVCLLLFIICGYKWQRFLFPKKCEWYIFCLIIKIGRLAADGRGNYRNSRKWHLFLEFRIFLMDVRLFFTKGFTNCGRNRTMWVIYI